MASMDKILVDSTITLTRISPRILNIILYDNYNVSSGIIARLVTCTTSLRLVPDLIFSAPLRLIAFVDLYTKENHSSKSDVTVAIICPADHLNYAVILRLKRS